MAPKPTRLRTQEAADWLDIPKTVLWAHVRAGMARRENLSPMGDKPHARTPPRTGPPTREDARHGVFRGGMALDTL